MNNTTQGIDLDKLTRWTFDGGMTASVSADGQWVRFGDLARQQTPVTGKVTQHVKTYSERETEWKAANAVGVVPTQRMLREEVAELRAALATHQATLAAPADDFAVRFIEQRAQQYLQDHADTEPGTGALVFEFGEAGREYHSTLVELVDDIRKAQAESDACALPPPGWSCTRAAGHAGPCAAIPASPPKPAASQQANTVPEQQEKVAPPPRGTGSQHDAAVKLLLTALTRCRFEDSISGRSKIANDAVEALARLEQSSTAGAAKGGANNDNSKNVATTAAADKGNAR